MTSDSFFFFFFFLATAALFQIWYCNRPLSGVRLFTGYYLELLPASHFTRQAHQSRQRKDRQSDSAQSPVPTGIFTPPGKVENASAACIPHSNAPTPYRQILQSPAEDPFYIAFPLNPHNNNNTSPIHHPSHSLTGHRVCDN